MIVFSIALIIFKKTRQGQAHHALINLKQYFIFFRRNSK
jgi:hypothetical protein